MKLVIQIPCFNEEATLPATLAALPRRIPGVDQVEVLVVDDGSSDRTAQVARECGADHVVKLPSNQGLARAFQAGLEASLRTGADIIVNTDGDNQYVGADIPKLIAPIRNGDAEIVIGARPIDEIAHFSWTKRKLQKLGGWVVRRLSRTQAPDPPSGFRAISRRAALELNVFSDYTYTLETIIQAGHKNIPIASVPIRTNGPLRPSRLAPHIGSYVWRSAATIVRIFMLYRPLRFFLTLAAFPLAGGVALMLRWLLLFLYVDPTRSRAPSLIAAAILMFLGFQLAAIGLAADLLAANRKLLEEVQLRLRRQDLDRVSDERRNQPRSAAHV
ncbi:MAG: glycosyltransferase family 2 protein [Bryobacteraceae bacterium]|nr:glycosyltransferase family 2 protein [Bryobacteraceae bacterium]